MAYNNNMVGNNDNKLNTNSEGVTFYGDLSVVRLGYYNNFVSIQMCPIKPPEERTPKSVYDYNTRTSCIISKEDALYLTWVLNNVFTKKTEALEPCFTGIQTGQGTMFVISNGITEEDKTVKPFMAIYKGFDDKKRPAERRVFAFRPKMVITKYNPDTGESDALNDNRYGIFVLAEFFDQASKALCGGYAHFARHFERFRNNSDYHIIKSIAGKLGVSENTNNGQVNFVGGNNGNTNWGSGNNGSANLSSSNANVGDIAALMSGSSMDEIPGLE